MPIEHMFCLICNEQCIKLILSHKKCSLLSSVFNSHFVDGTRTSHGIALTITKLIDFLVLSRYFYFLFATVIN